jgi:hypothetical protein
MYFKDEVIKHMHNFIFGSLILGKKMEWAAPDSEKGKKE